MLGLAWAHRFSISLAAILLFMSLMGCRSAPDYTRPLPPGANALRLVPPDQWPRLTPAMLAADSELLAAARRSRTWFAIPSTVRHFPVEGISHEQARLSVEALAWMLERLGPGQSLAPEAMRREFDLYKSIGWDDRGTVLFTGYYAPVFTASWTRSGRFQHPLHRLPDALVKPENPDEPVRWRRPDGSMGTPPTRGQLERQGLLAGHELVYMESALDAFIVQVQGSAKLRMTDGSTVHVGYAGDNGHDYVSLGQELVADRRIPRDHSGLPAIRDYFDRNPDKLREYLHRNPRFIFFQEYDQTNWPSGSLGFQVSPWRSLATDKRIFPRGMPMLVDTTVPRAAGGTRPFRQIMFDQDTGGAIRAPGRADIYMGIGLTAEAVAGRQKHEGAMYYFVLKPDRIPAWRGLIDRSRP
ncbi:MAG: MltA domain-containing protein [Phycisphaeraceae bacterium]|nr:MltA domain-containing protein [Phycisphaeraceae bacterium]